MLFREIIAVYCENHKKCMYWPSLISISYRVIKVMYLNIPVSEKICIEINKLSGMITE
jgi:hypothetical protein